MILFFILQEFAMTPLMPCLDDGRRAAIAELIEKYQQ